MEDLRRLIAQAVREEDGQDLVEYALLLGFIAVVGGIAAQGLGLSVAGLLNAVATGVAAIPTVF